MKKSILIIDDNPENCEDYVAPLKEHYKVTTCMSLFDAVRKVMINNYDLIVIDIMMPTNGIDNKDELKSGLFLYEEKFKPLEDVKELHFLFWSNLSRNTYDEYFDKSKPDNVEFAHKETKDKNHLLNIVNQLIG